MPNTNGLIECRSVCGTGDLTSNFYARTAGGGGGSGSTTITTSQQLTLSSILPAGFEKARVLIEAVGGGGGGSATGTTGSTWLGAGGGGSGYISTFDGLFPANYIFDITIGAGGIGGQPGLGGTDGGATIVQNVLNDSRIGINDPKTILVNAPGGKGATSANGGDGYFGGGGSASINGPGVGGLGGAGIIPAYNGQAGDSAPGFGTGNGLPGSGAGVMGEGNYGYFTDRNNNIGGGGGGGIQSSLQGRGAGENGPATNGAPGCGGGGSAVYTGIGVKAGNGGAGYVIFTIIPIA